jgi:hypothetical protein
MEDDKAFAQTKQNLALVHKQKLALLQLRMYALKQQQQLQSTSSCTQHRPCLVCFSLSLPPSLCRIFVFLCTIFCCVHHQLSYYLDLLFYFSWCSWDPLSALFPIQGYIYIYI